jgi:hypothetical protein
VHPVRVVRCFDGRQFDQEHVIDQQIHEVLANQDVVGVHLCAVLLHGRQADGTEFIIQRVLTDLLRNPAPNVLSSSLLSACFACIAFLHLRQDSCLRCCGRLIGRRRRPYARSNPLRQDTSAQAAGAGLSVPRASTLVLGSAGALTSTTV